MRHPRAFSARIRAVLQVAGTRKGRWWGTFFIHDGGAPRRAAMGTGYCQFGHNRTGVNRVPGSDLADLGTSHFPAMRFFFLRTGVNFEGFAYRTRFLITFTKENAAFCPFWSCPKSDGASQTFAYQTQFGGFFVPDSNSTHFGGSGGFASRDASVPEDSR